MSEIFGRWDLTIDLEGERYPSWVEITAEGGQFVGRFGSARPLGNCAVEEHRVQFGFPNYTAGLPDELNFRGHFAEGCLVGTTTSDDGKVSSWLGVRAPALPKREVKFGPTINLIEPDLRNWHPRTTHEANQWSVQGGHLVNETNGTDLVTNQAFGDFHLVAEYHYPKDSNSGIYLRGRYELQIWDDFESPGTAVGNSGAIYGFLAPSAKAIRPFGELNRAEVTLVGRFVTVVLNGITIINDQEIPGITGGALDSVEGHPGQMFLQGDHGPVTFTRLEISPAL